MAMNLSVAMKILKNGNRNITPISRSSPELYWRCRLWRLWREWGL